jgi:sporulation protein YlmC with PRC-barrel domain
VKLHHDLLDKQLLDKSATRIGRVDGLIAIWDGKQPRVIALETGLAALARRSGFARLLRRFFGSPDAKAFRIPWTNVKNVGLEVKVEIGISEIPLHQHYMTLRKKILNRIPGGKHGEK